jgi:hypothetical protein
MKKNATFWLWLGVSIITIISTWLRVYHLDSNPAVLNPDEASVAYNALLLKETGKDEWGKSWPLVLNAFGDQKIAGYTIMTIASFYLLGYTDVAVRLTALISGIALIPLTALLVFRWSRSVTTAFFTTLCLALLPVFHFYSRIGFEALPSLVFILLLVDVLMRKSTTRWWHFALIILFGSLAIFFYNSPLIILPALSVLPLLGNPRNTFKTWLPQGLFILLIWLAWMVLLHQLVGQKSKITLFDDPTIRSEYLAYRQSMSEPWLTVFGNQYLYYGGRVMQNYFSLYQPGFLLNNQNGHPWHALNGHGYVTLPILMLSMLGILLSGYGYYRKQNRRFILVVVYILLLAPLPGAITVNAPHATRSLLFFWILAVLSGYILAALIKRAVWGRIISFALLFLAVFYFYHYIHDYHLFFPENSRVIWHDQLYPTIETTQNTRNTPPIIYDPRGFDYIRAAWYGKVPPVTYFNTSVKSPPDIINFHYSTALAGWTFTKDLPNELPEGASLIFWNGHNWEIQ